MQIIKGYGNKYDTYITEDGHVFVDRPSSFQELQQESSSKGYYRVMFANKPRLVHRLVGETYITKPKGCNVINHLDEDKTNNQHTNLEWTTQSGNMKHYYRDKRYKLSGVLNCNAKLTDEDVLTIRQRLSTGESAVKIAKDFLVGHTTIYNIKLGKSYL